MERNGTSMRTIATALLLLLVQGCAFKQLHEDLTEFYADPESIASRVVLVDRPLQVSTLDAPAFIGSNGRKGLWQPLSFIKEKRGGVYLLEPYDAHKIPVLFIHGAGGTPQDWRFFISRLDRSRYQPWVYYYPTGLPIDLSAAWLHNFVATLHREFGFSQLAIAAHSMGGLVAHRFLALDAEGGKRGYSTLLTTFSTPFGGVPAARLALTLGAYAVPSWRDLIPDSAFLLALKSAALPKTVKHHVFFAYQQEGDDFDSDGVISVASQLAADTAHTHGFRTDHSDILDSLEVFRGFAALLAAFR
jgi:pimeloyl-ACP methyl ester carboxylesterase